MYTWLLALSALGLGVLAQWGWQSTAEKAQTPDVLVASERSWTPVQIPTVAGQLLSDQQPLVLFDAQQSQRRVVYFGFTNCPDVCPLSMQRLGQAFTKLPESLQQRLLVVFVSLDPKRDDPTLTQQYAQYFSPHFKGATASVTQLKGLTLSSGFDFVISPLSDGRYNVDHPSAFFLYEPDGRLMGLLSGELSVEKLVQSLQNWAESGQVLHALTPITPLEES